MLLWCSYEDGSFVSTSHYWKSGNIEEQWSGKQEYDYVKCSLLNRTKLMHTSIHTVATCHTLDLHKVKPVKIPAWMSSNCQLMVVKGGDKLVLDLWPLIGCLCSSKWCPKHSHMVSTTWTEWAIKDYFLKDIQSTGFRLMNTRECGRLPVEGR